MRDISRPAEELLAVIEESGPWSYLFINLVNESVSHSVSQSVS